MLYPPVVSGYAGMLACVSCTRNPAGQNGFTVLSAYPGFPALHCHIGVSELVCLKSPECLGCFVYDFPDRGVQDKHIQKQEGRVRVNGTTVGVVSGWCPYLIVVWHSTEHSLYICQLCF